MPPRARKAAAPPPSLEEADVPETAAPSGVAPIEAETPPAAAQAAGAQKPDGVEPEPEESTPAGRAVAALLEPPAVTYRWISANGDGSTPCRLCAPAGPPVGAGSFGCGHGQWVRVENEAA